MSASERHHGTYFTDQERIEEIRRLVRQGHAITRGTEYLTSQIPDVSALHDVLDLACGPGEWALQFADEHRDTRVTAVDISERMINYARVQASRYHLPVTYRVMDITKPLDFPDASFDFVNVRFIMAFMLQEQWPDLLAAIMRVLRPGGFVRLCEQESILTTDARTSLYAQWWNHAFHTAGHTFAEEPSVSGYCIGIMLKRLLQGSGFTSIREYTYDIDMSTGEPAHADTLETVSDAFKVGEAFLLKYGPGLTHGQINEARQYMRACINKPDFCCYWHILTAIGQKPKN